MKNVRSKKENDELTMNLRVPSKRVAIVSRNVFWGANSPFRAGIGGVVNLRYRPRSAKIKNGKQLILTLTIERLCICRNPPICMMYVSEIGNKFDA